MGSVILDKLIKFLKLVNDYFLFAVIALLLIFIYFKNIKIENLTAKLEEKPKVEYVYNTVTDTIKINVLKPYQVIKWKETKDTVYVPLDLTTADSTQIAKAYKKLFEEFGTENVYKDVVKDDSTARIELTELIQYNKIQDRIVMFTDRTPVVHLTNTKYVYTTSIVGGIEAGTAGVEIGAGIITKRNTFIKVSYDPFNKTVRGGGYFSIFNFKNK